MTPDRRARILRYARWGAAVTLLVAVSTRVDFRALGRLLVRIPPATAALLVVLVIAQQALLAARFRVVMKAWATSVGAGAVPLRLHTLVGDQLVSTAYNAILPSAVGGDVVRFWLARRYVSADAGDAGAMTVVLLDRLVGLGVLAFVPLLVVAYRSGTVTTAAVCVVVPLVLVAFDRLLPFVVRLVPPRFERLHGFANAVARAAASVSARDVSKMVSWSFAYQATVGAFFEIASSTWEAGPGIHEAIWIGIPIASILTVIPVSIGGMGLRESLYVAVSERSGVASEVGLAMALLWAAQGLLTAVAGAAIESRRAARPEDVPRPSAGTP